MPAQRPPVLCGILCAALLIVTLAWGHQPPVRAAEPAIVYASGGSLVSGTPGPAAVLPVQAANVQSLGAATVLVGYDPASLKAIACQRNTLFDVGLCNTTYDRNADGTPDAVLFNVVSLLGVSAPGPVVLTNITWQSVTAVSEATITALSVQVQTFADTEGKPLSHSGQNGEITLLPVPPTPTATATPAPTPTRTVTPTLATKKSISPCCCGLSLRHLRRLLRRQRNLPSRRLLKRRRRRPRPIRANRPCSRAAIGARQAGHPAGGVRRSPLAAQLSTGALTSTSHFIKI